MMGIDTWSTVFASGIFSSSLPYPYIFACARWLTSLVLLNDGNWYYLNRRPNIIDLRCLPYPYIFAALRWLTSLALLNDGNWNYTPCCGEVRIFLTHIGNWNPARPYWPEGDLLITSLPIYLRCASIIDVAALLNDGNWNFFSFRTKTILLFCFLTHIGNWNLSQVYDEFRVFFLLTHISSLRSMINVAALLNDGNWNS